MSAQSATLSQRLVNRSRHIQDRCPQILDRQLFIAAFRASEAEEDGTCGVERGEYVGDVVLLHSWSCLLRFPMRHAHIGAMSPDLLVVSRMEHGEEALSDMWTVFAR